MFISKLFFKKCMPTFLFNYNYLVTALVSILKNNYNRIICCYRTVVIFSYYIDVLVFECSWNFFVSQTTVWLLMLLQMLHFLLQTSLTRMLGCSVETTTSQFKILTSLHHSFSSWQSENRDNLMSRAALKGINSHLKVA